jgi:hypothetical protein
MKITRKQFLATGLAAAGAAAGVAAAGCGGDDDGGGGGSSGGDCSNSDASVEIGSNHGHGATVTSAEVTAGAAVVKDIQGGATHSHNLELSTADIEKLKGGGSVTKQSTGGPGHEHSVTVRC